MNMIFKYLPGSVCSLTSDRYRYLIFATLLLLSACGQPDNNGRDNVRNNMPPIHFDQTVELILEGGNSARETYQNTLRNCRAAGMQTRELTEHDAALVGITRYEGWFEPNREVIRERSWEVANDGPAGTCLFRLKMSGLQETTTAEHYEQLDLATGERNVQPSTPDALLRLPIGKDEEQTSAGFEGPQRKTVFGQPCNEWLNRSSGFRQCVWAAGTEWGFTSTGLNDYRPRRDFIVLEQMPLNDQGFKVTTSTITIGKAFDPSTLKTPSSGDRN
ncbi:hypothetical protein [Pseudomonas syringae]|uniref:hypothetical protein n=1 Tax=Pseudomonas syringae TaxID=317 RepID=UPI00046CAFE2|nr:hypothetical protein [Pseudomonas syringae]